MAHTWGFFFDELLFVPPPVSFRSLQTGQKGDVRVPFFDKLYCHSNVLLITQAAWTYLGSLRPF